jgi:hypothetical protein
MKAAAGFPSGPPDLRRPSADIDMPGRRFASPRKELDSDLIDDFADAATQWQAVSAQVVAGSTIVVSPSNVEAEWPSCNR